MQARRDFLIRCLRLADIKVTMAYYDLNRLLQRAEAVYKANANEDTYRELIVLKRNAATLNSFKVLLEKSLDSLQQKPAILPALTPLFMLMHGIIPLDKKILDSLRASFINLTSVDTYLSKKFDQKFFNNLVSEYENTEPNTTTCAAYIHENKNLLAKKISAFISVFSEVLFSKNATIQKMVANDAFTLEKQMGRAFMYPTRQYNDQSQPTSKADITAQIAGSSPEALTHLKLSLAIPWPENQIGQTCKIHAFYAVAWVLHLLNPQLTPLPPPVHATPGMPTDKLSLVQQAQKLFSSKIGEVYSPEYLMNLIKNNGYNNVALFKCDKTNYISKLKSLIDKGALALIYFDVSVDPKKPETFGAPTQQNSNYEHSAVVWGYSTTVSDQTTFYVYQWNQFYKFNAEDLLASTDQLKERKGEIFYDVGTREEPDWQELNRIKEHDPELLDQINKKQYQAKLFSPPAPVGLPSFQNCIIGFGPNLQQELKEEKTISKKPKY